MPLFVKICGLCSPADVNAVAALSPDAMGFVFWPGSKRCVQPASVGEWTKGQPSSIRKVGVFVNATADAVRSAVEEARLDVVQLHGNESPEFCASMPAAVWKRVGVETQPMTLLEAYRVDAFLLDSYSAEAPGGTGRVLNWGLASEFVKACSKPVVLAGGLTPDNVAEAIRRVGPWGVDVSSGVEFEPGRKDLTKVRAFIQRCRET